MLDEERLHRALIGAPRSRAQLNTPVLVLDRDALGRNLTKMAELARQRGVALRPHAKTHKSVDIARRQLAHGAVGICCAKLGEAEVFAAANVQSILITSPVVTPQAIARLARLNAQLEQLIVVVDHPDNAAALAQAVRSRRLQVLIDVDPGIRRTGVVTPEAALALWREIQGLPALQYRGVQYYCGLQQHVAAYEERRAAIAERTAYLQGVIALLTEHAGKPEIISGSGTGTHQIDAELGVFTEWQVGSYAFMDRQYADCQLESTPGQAFEFSLFVETSVVSANTSGIATCDAGFKALATDGGAPVIVAGAPEGATYHFMGDEHGLVVDAPLKHVWQLGDGLRLAVPHCDPTVNLYDAYHVVSGDVLVDIWPVSARGRSR